MVYLGLGLVDSPVRRVLGRGLCTRLLVALTELALQ